MKKDVIITLGREFCSGGAEVAHKLSERMNIPYYDRDLIDQVVENTNLDHETVASREERFEATRKGKQFAALWYREDPTLTLPVHMRIYAAQCEAIRRMAGEGPCVILGRCADYVLDECSQVIDTLNVFIRADLDLRVTRAMRIYNRPEEETRKVILKTDKIRSKYYQSHTNRQWGAPDNYDLIVDTGRVGTDGAAEIIEAAVKALIENRGKTL